MVVAPPVLTGEERGAPACNASSLSSPPAGKIQRALMVPSCQLRYIKSPQFYTRVKVRGGRHGSSGEGGDHGNPQLRKSPNSTLALVELTPHGPGLLFV